MKSLLFVLPLALFLSACSGTSEEAKVMENRIEPVAEFVEVAEEDFAVEEAAEALLEAEAELDATLEDLENLDF